MTVRLDLNRSWTKARRITANIAELPNLLISTALSKEDGGTWPGFGS